MRRFHDASGSFRGRKMGPRTGGVRPSVTAPNFGTNGEGLTDDSASFGDPKMGPCTDDVRL